MHTFTDLAGREWHLHGTFDSYARVHSDTGVRLDDIGTESRKSLGQLQDTFTLGAVLWSMIEPEAEDRGVTVELFRQALDGTVLEAAHEALVREMVFFCPPRQRKVLELAVRKVKDAEVKIQRAADAALQQAEKEIDAAIDKWIRGSSASNLPASSASTPADGAFENLSGLPPADNGKPGITPAASLPN